MSTVEWNDDYLTRTWNEIDWDEAKEKLRTYQQVLYDAEKRREFEKVIAIEESMVNDLDIRCLAVKFVGDSRSGPGVDKVRWKTPADFMQAALLLNPKDYKAKPYRQIILKTKYNAKERRAGLPTYYDRAMAKLYSFVLGPLSEAHADKKSFAFREGRSALDALEYVQQAVCDADGPEFVVVADIQTFYATIEHDWIMEHVPIDKHVLHEFLTAGIVFAGALFESDGSGISEGCNLSPYIGNFVLDGLQAEIFNALNPGKTTDFANGNMVRFADDIIVTVRSLADAERVLHVIADFLAVRGLCLSPVKTHIRSMHEGFTFLSQTFMKSGGLFIREPSEKAVENKISECVGIIEDWNRSQRELIEKLNAKLSGWANYHRFCDARKAFKRVDIAIQTALLDSCRKKHPTYGIKKIIERYWTVDAAGEHYYALKKDPSVRLMHLSDTLLSRYVPVRVSSEPYNDASYEKVRKVAKQIRNVSGPYKAIWDRQGGRCYYCGRKILIDEPKKLITKDLAKPRTHDNAAYVHKLCSQNQLEIIELDEDVSYLQPYDVLYILNLLTEADREGMVLYPLPRKWKYKKLHDYFHVETKAKLTLSFDEIESIIEDGLPPSAYNGSGFWYRKPKWGPGCISNCWERQGYRISKLDLDKGRVSFQRVVNHMVPFQIPKRLLDRKIPEDAEFKLQQVCAAIIKEYNL